jgi:hypothetical protein
MHRGSMQPSVAILVSEYASVATRPVRSRTRTGLSPIALPKVTRNWGPKAWNMPTARYSFLGGTSRVEDSIIYTRYQTWSWMWPSLTRMPPNTTGSAVSKGSSLARRLVSKAVHVLPLETGTPTPTALSSAEARMP